MFKNQLKLDAANDAPIGGSGAPTPTPPVSSPLPTPASATAAATDAPSIKDVAPQSTEVKAAGSDDNYDDLGYLKQKSSDEPGKENKESAKEAAKAPEQKLEDIKDAVTGYGVKAVEEPKDDPAPVAPVKEVDPNAPPPIEVDTTGLDDGAAAKLKDFFKANNLNKEQAQAFVSLIKAETVANAQLREQAIKQQKIAEDKIRAGWDKELRADPAFGGENLQHNLFRAEKVLSEFMPNTKKELTGKGSMLPPYVMRDLAKLYETLRGSEKFIHGDAPTAQKEEKVVSPLDFYT